GRTPQGRGRTRPPGGPAFHRRMDHLKHTPAQVFFGSPQEGESAPASATWVARSGEGAPPSTRSRRPPRTRPPVGRPTRSPRSKPWRPKRPPTPAVRRTRPASPGTLVRSPADFGFRAPTSTLCVWHVSPPNPSPHLTPTVPAMRNPYPGTPSDT